MPAISCSVMSGRGAGSGSPPSSAASTHRLRRLSCWHAALVGVGDIDPFVLGLAQGGGAGLAPRDVVAAVIIATSSNNLLKAAYCVAFAGWRATYAPALALVALSVAGGLAAMLVR